MFCLQRRSWRETGTKTTRRDFSVVVVPCMRVPTAGQMNSVLRVLGSSVWTGCWARKLAGKPQGEAALVGLALGVLWQGNWHKNDEARFLCGGCPLHESTYSWTNELCDMGFYYCYVCIRPLGKRSGENKTRPASLYELLHCIVFVFMSYSCDFLRSSTLNTERFMCLVLACTRSLSKDPGRMMERRHVVTEDSD